MSKSVKSLSLRRKKFSDSEILGVFGMLPNLDSLDLSYTAVNDLLLCEIAERNSKIRDLYLEGCDFITNYGVRKIVDSCLELRLLDVKNCPDFNDPDYVTSHGIRLDWFEYESNPESFDFSDPSELFHSDFNSYNRKVNNYDDDGYYDDDYYDDDDCCGDGCYDDDHCYDANCFYSKFVSGIFN
ncbi:hypothetical protein H4S08_003768 [Coemansia sp. RSA 1365]|nr:hypothetical protein H4S08_003768 [Coemansia sp. RSA 1365]